MNSLITNVPYPFDTKYIDNIISLYYLDKINQEYRIGGITFPYIDTDIYSRTIQVKQFDMNNKTIGQGFLHTMLDAEYKNQNRIPPKWLKDYMEQDSKISCFFGSHLLNKYPNNPIALVEAPKTAIYVTLYFGNPENPANYLFLAVYNYSSLNAQKFQELSGRNVTLFPDLSQSGNAYKGWNEKKSHFESLYPGTKIQVSDLLEKNANQTDRKNGLDLADYLIRLDWREFIQK